MPLENLGDSAWRRPWGMNKLLLGGAEGQEGAFQMGLFTLLPGKHSTKPCCTTSASWALGWGGGRNKQIQSVWGHVRKSSLSTLCSVWVGGKWGNKAGELVRIRSLRVLNARLESICYSLWPMGSHGRFWAQQWPDQSCALFRTISPATHTCWIREPRGREGQAKCSGARVSGRGEVWAAKRMAVVPQPAVHSCRHCHPYAHRWTCYLILISGAVRTDTLKTRLLTKSRCLDSVLDKHRSCGVRLPGFKFQLSHLLAVQPPETRFTPKAPVSSQDGNIWGALSEGLDTKCLAQCLAHRKQ